MEIQHHEQRKLAGAKFQGPDRHVGQVRTSQKLTPDDQFFRRMRWCQHNVIGQ